MRRLSYLPVLVLAASCLDAAAQGGEGDSQARRAGIRASPLLSLRSTLTSVENHVLKQLTGTQDGSSRTTRKSETRSGVKSESDSLVMVGIVLLVPLLAAAIFLLVYVNADDGVMQPVSRPKIEGRKRAMHASAPMSRASPQMSERSGQNAQGLIPLSGLSSESVVRQAHTPQSPNEFEFASTAPALCANYVVTKREGMRLSVPQQLRPEPQSMTLDIASISDGGRIIARAVLVERHDGGILLETTGHTAIAFLDTSFASVSSSGGPQNRYVILRRAQGAGWDDAGAPFAVFFAKNGKDGSTLVARSGDAPGRSRPFLSGLFSPDGRMRQLTDAHQRVLADSEPMVGGSEQCILNVYQGADASLVLCAMFAAQKLR